MDETQALAAFAALSQPTRLQAFRLLVQAGPDGMAAGDIATALGQKQNTMSANLAILLQAGLVRNQREGRAIRYFSNMDGTRDMLAFLIEDCCGGQTSVCQPLLDSIPKGGRVMADVKNILFLCTGNSIRSIFAEAIANKLGDGRFKAYSAGSDPRGEAHPKALSLLKGYGYDTGFARSKSWDEFAADDAPQMDFVITVCDQAAGEACPLWPGQPMSAHWGIADPARATGTEGELDLAFAQAYSQMHRRISIFMALPMAQLDAMSLQAKMDEIGLIDDTAEAEAESEG